MSQWYASFWNLFYHKIWPKWCKDAHLYWECMPKVLNNLKLIQKHMKLNPIGAIKMFHAPLQFQLFQKLIKHYIALGKEMGLKNLCLRHLIGKLVNKNSTRILEHIPIHYILELKLVHIKMSWLELFLDQFVLKMFNQICDQIFKYQISNSKFHNKYKSLKNYLLFYI